MAEQSVAVQQGERAGRGLRLWRERGGEIEPHPTERGVFLVPSCRSAVPYAVDLAAERCGCGDWHRRRRACKHVFALVVWRAKRRGEARRRLAAPAGCAGCGESFPLGELVELHEGNHDGITHFDGERLCSECCERAGVAV